MMHRGIRNIDEPRDKLVRARTILHNEMIGYDRTKSYKADFDDIMSEVWTFGNDILNYMMKYYSKKTKKKEKKENEKKLLA